MYRVFTRTWWKNNPEYPDGLEPEMGKKHGLKRFQTEEEARAYAVEWNRTHNPGRLSNKAEYEDVMR